MLCMGMYTTTEPQHVSHITSRTMTRSAATAQSAPRRTVLVALATALAIVAAMGLSAPPAGAATTLAKPYDFDGNGYVDLAIGAPSLRVSTVRRAGGVVVLPSSRSGPSRSEKIVTQSSSGVPGASEVDDQFGYAVASADFNKDGYADLAVGQPGETVGTVDAAGSVTVIYGSKTGSTRSDRRPSPNRAAPGKAFPGEHHW